MATMLPEFDIIYGHMIEFFHDLQIVRTPIELNLLNLDSTLTQPELNPNSTRTQAFFNFFF